MYKVIGIDEAGKGPVIGSMFIGFAIINLAGGLKDLNEFQKHLKDLGVDDSKKINPKKRSIIFENIKKNLDIKYSQLTPNLIDQNFFSGKTLNELEINAIVTILKEEKPDLVLIDGLTSKPEKFAQDIYLKLGDLREKIKIISENKADQKYEIVGAASIIAKHLREQEISQIKENIGLDCGSGYTSDKKTIEFLKKNWNNKEFDFIFRKSWKTFQRIANSNQKTLNDF